MELVDGPSLARVLAAGPLAPARAMDVLAQAAAGLQAAHAAGLVHRDVKPGNLLVGRSGEVKITDFGIAHATWSAPLTQAGVLVGTPAYLAPERVTGGAATPASDLYSLGVVGYQCLTGAVPFAGGPPVTAAHQPRPLPPLPAAVPAGVAELVLDLTARDPAARPASAGEVAARAGRLRDALAGRPAATRPAGPSGGPPAEAMGAELAGDPATLIGEPFTLAGEPFPFAGEPAPGMAPDHRRARREGMRPGRNGMPPGQEERRPGRERIRPGRERMRPGRGRMRAGQRGTRPGRGVVLAVAGVVLVAGLAGWLLAGAFGAGPRPAAPGGPPPAERTPAAAGRPPSAPAGRMVEVNADALAGQQASVVRQRLRRMGLRPHIVRAVRGGQAPGTVISVQPSGRVPAGSTVTVTAALPPPGQGNGNGNGQGNNDD
jgi:serine/threonine-protein kinase